VHALGRVRGGIGMELEGGVFGLVVTLAIHLHSKRGFSSSLIF